MKKKILILFIFFGVMPFSSIAQKIQLAKDSLNLLRDQKSIHLEFDFNHVSVEGQDEAVFVADKKAELNTKERGRGDEWEKKWNADKNARFEPTFAELLGKYSKLSTFDKREVKYTLILKTLKLEPGKWATGNKALLSGEALIVETQNRNNIIALIILTEIPGRKGPSFDGSWEAYDAGVRMEESYAKAGKMIGELIANRLK